jgi:predicted nucleic acid-binding protein
MNAVDTNVFVYSMDRNEPAKLAKAQLLLQNLHLSASITTLYTEDMGAPRTIDTVQLVNPFV